LEIAANAYLHHMVRNIVGTLIAAQREADPAAAMGQVLAGGNRRFAGATAPAAGLCLWRVEYPPAFGIPAPPDDEILPSSTAAATLRIELN
jgi:tRNA pseudouridine38-40 synthase